MVSKAREGPPRYPTSFGERSRETRSLRDEKVRSAPTRLGPILSNISLSKLDAFVEETLIPVYSRGDRRRANPAYSRIDTTIQRKRKKGKMEEVKRLEQQRRTLPSVDPYDPDYRRIRYCRYADDWLIGFIGPKEEAEEIKSKVGEFLNEHLKLELSKTKTLITINADVYLAHIIV